MSPPVSDPTPGIDDRDPVHVLLGDRITRALTDCILDVDQSQVFRGLLDDVVAATGSDCGVVIEVDPGEEGSRAARVWAAANLLGADASAAGLERRAAAVLHLGNFQSVFDDVCADGEPVVGTFPSASPDPDDLYPMAFLGLPLRLGDTLWGVLLLARRHGCYQPGLVARLAPLAETCAVLIRTIQRRECADGRPGSDDAAHLGPEHVATVSHELRTPLTSVRASLGLLAAGTLGELPTPAAEMVELARSNTERMIDLVNDLLDFEKLRVGHLVLETAPVEPLSVAEVAAAVVSSMATEAGVELLVGENPPDRVVVDADFDRLVQVLVNLLGNAIEFSPEGGTVRIDLEADADVCEFRVVDEGPGIAADQLDAVFEPFRQAGTSERRRSGGTGLGLAIARSITDAHGGQISVRSELGAGSCFSVKLPRHT